MLSLDKRLEEIKEKIDKRISERTGLKTSEEIEAYAKFCHHSSLRDGVILYGDVQHEFYVSLFQNASLAMKVLERAFHEAACNDFPNDKSDNCLRSPISTMAQKKFQQFYHQFMEKDLIAPPKYIGISNSQYPVLKGYNYLKDSEFYEVEITENSTSSVLKI